MSQDRFDVVIVGAGMVGATLALALGRERFSCALIDARQPEPWQADNYRLRVSSINSASEQILRALGAWGGVEKRRCSPFRRMCVWQNNIREAIEFDAHNINRPHLGHIVENDVVTAALWETLHDLGQIEIACPESLTGLVPNDQGIEVQLQSGRRLFASLVVGADGAFSKVRELSGITAAQRNYEQKAIVATVATSEPHQETAYQRFLETGPLAFLPLADGTSSIVWSCDEPRAEELLALDDDHFNRAMENATQNHFEQTKLASERRAFPLRRRHAQTYLAPRVALIGDAAHVAHPLAGLGANLGFADAASLAQVLGEARNKSRDFGAYHVLRRYERWRRGENGLVLNTMDLFKNSFGSDLAGIRRLAGLGLRIGNHTGPLKQVVMSRAMGLSGDLPELAIR